MRKPVTKSKKKKSIHQLKRELWKHFSLYIKLRDKYICFTCGKHCEKDSVNSGHFYHGKSVESYTDEKNVNCQCISCNMYKSGNLAVYAGKLIDKYGVNIISELSVKRHTIKKWVRVELENDIEDYKTKIKELEE